MQPGVEHSPVGETRTSPNRRNVVILLRDEGTLGFYWGGSGKTRRGTHDYDPGEGLWESSVDLVNFTSYCPLFKTLAYRVLLLLDPPRPVGGRGRVGVDGVGA